MTADNKGIAVSTVGDRAFVRVCGRGTFQNSRSLRSFAQETIAQGAREFVVDLGGCTGLDSTFMGVLAGIGLRLRQLPVPGKLTVAQASARNRELFQTLGLDRLLTVLPETEGIEMPPGTAFRWLPESDIERLTHALDKGETAGMMLEAHEDLMRADKRNVARFQEITRLLREQRERHPPAKD